MIQDLDKQFADKGIRYIHAEYDNPDDMYNALKAMEKFTNENVTMYGTSREGCYDFIIHEDIDMDEDKTKTDSKDENKGEE